MFFYKKDQQLPRRARRMPDWWPVVSHTRHSLVPSTLPGMCVIYQWSIITDTPLSPQPSLVCKYTSGLSYQTYLVHSTLPVMCVGYQWSLIPDTPLSPQPSLVCKYTSGLSYQTSLVHSNLPGMCVVYHKSSIPVTPLSPQPSLVCVLYTLSRSYPTLLISTTIILYLLVNYPRWKKVSGKYYYQPFYIN